MSELLHWIANFALGLGYILIWMFCLVGLLLSCLSISGTWLVVVAAIVGALLPGTHFPGLGLILLFIYFAVMVEVVEYVAGFWGVKKRGGSSWAGVLALVGGLLGLVIGSVIPIPILGSLLGMMAGSFALVYLFESNRLGKSGPALHIAMGAVLARVMVVFLKVLVTLGMAAWLLIGMAAG